MNCLVVWSSPVGVSVQVVLLSISDASLRSVSGAARYENLENLLLLLSAASYSSVKISLLYQWSIKKSKIECWLLWLVRLTWLRLFHPSDLWRWKQLTSSDRKCCLVWGGDLTGKVTPVTYTDTHTPTHTRSSSHYRLKAKLHPKSKED